MSICLDEESSIKHFWSIYQVSIGVITDSPLPTMHMVFILLSEYDTVVSNYIPKSTVFGPHAPILSVGEPGLLLLLDVSEMYQKQILQKTTG